MLSLSLGRDGWVEAAAPAPRIDAHCCAARRLLLYSSFLLAILEVALLETPQPTAMQRAATLCEGKRAR